MLRDSVFLILEPKGYDEIAAVKEQAAERWVTAVNADGRFGEWRYAVTNKINAIPSFLDDIESAAGALA